MSISPVDFFDLVKQNRSYRRFEVSQPISEKTLTELVEIARHCSSANNSQSLRYKIVHTEAECSKLFTSLHWAALLKDWKGPTPQERPTGYIIICTDTTVRKNADIDLGIAAQTILLAAQTRGFGGCMLGAIERQNIAHDFGIDTSRYDINLVIALGKPHENVTIVGLNSDGSTAYYRDEHDVHCVPKRPLKDILL
ncbi:MAG: nitroreductase family protein [Treponema sp.]|nr:nitroreductase family protein [Treponema sp.]